MNERQSYEEASNAFYPESAESEPLEVPTEEVEADELPLEESDAEVEDLDSEESESEDEEADEVEDDGVIEIDGEDHNLSDIQEWKQAHDNVKSMQADCTKKWQEASELKKDAESEMSKAQDLALTLEVLIAEDEEVDLDELKEYDEVEYYKRKEKINARKAKLKELKANQPSSAPVLTQDELSAELSSLYAHDASWLKDGKPTEKFNTDMNIAGAYLTKNGYTQEEVNAISMSRHWKTIVDASKYEATQKKKTAVKKRLLKTPKAKAPTANSKSKLAPHEIMYGADT